MVPYTKPACILVMVSFASMDSGFLQLYYDKTVLKGIKGRETDYNMAKANLNSLYGMMVTLTTARAS